MRGQAVVTGLVQRRVAVIFNWRRARRRWARSPRLYPASL